MIEADRMKVRIRGNLPMLAAEFESIIRGFKSVCVRELGEDGANDFLDEVIRRGRLSEKDVEEMNKGFIKDEMEIDDEEFEKLAAKIKKIFKEALKDE